MLVRKNGASNWVHISNRMGRRTPKQCRERYHQNLKPTLNRNQITDEEGQEILRHVAEIGKQWAEIARRMHDRSDNAVKNWWNGYENRRKRTERRNAMAKQASHASSIPVDSTTVSPQQHQHYQYSCRYHHQHFQHHLAQAAARDPRMRIDTLLS
ncbi:Myb-like DNA-binding protein myb-1 [Escovopsis weberi]|uniref:Myb-like DNA-binding protein myb-1 n=1 Tax=Escovopsis weberi TaxID=150374 RepID=A0A0M9VS46_ESCWE|nr:Myb-like DNA-binding protein myb-1 [Escovopsis weberi]